MFKGLAAFFETYSITAADAKNSNLHPVDLSLDLESTVNRTKNFLMSKGYGDFVYDKNFKELFGVGKKFEVTVSFILLQNGGTRIGVALYSPKGNKLTKKPLIALMQGLAQEFINEKI